MFKNLSHSYYNRGLKLAREKEIGPAIRSLSKAVQYNSDNIKAWNLAGLCYYRLGKYKMAEYCWNNGTRYRPKFVANRGDDGLGAYETNVNEANAYGANTYEADVNEANTYLADLKKTLMETGPYFSQIESLCRRKKYRQAAGILRDEVCSRFGESANLLNLLGVLLALSGRKNRAAKYWALVLDLDKSNADASRFLQNIETGIGYRLFTWKERLLERKDTK